MILNDIAIFDCEFTCLRDLTYDMIKIMKEVILC